MNEKNHSFCIFVSMLIAVMFFTIGRFTVSRSAEHTDGYGNGQRDITEQLISSRSRVVELESRLGRIRDTSSRIAEQIDSCFETSGAAADNIEKLRVIIGTLQESYIGIRDINSLSGGGAADQPF